MPERKRIRHIKESDVAAIVRDLDRWAAGQLGTKVTWALLEERHGFSRQALQAKPAIKAAYDVAKKSLSGGLVRTREQANEKVEELRREVQRLEDEIKGYQVKEARWHRRWQRIAYHIRERGIQMSSVDTEVPEQNKKLSDRETAGILKPFDKDIPPSGRC